MTGGVLTLGMATIAVASCITSASTWVMLPVLDKASGLLRPSAAVWLWRSVVFAPWLVALLVLAAVFGLVSDHCVAHGAHHPHLCFAHPTAWPGEGVAALAGLVLLRGLASLAVAASQARRSSRVMAALDAASLPGPDGTRRVPGAGPWALTLGMLRPRVYVTDGMAAHDDAAVVLEHERVHAAGRHPLWQWLASVAAALHLPGLGRPVVRRLAVTHEMAADAGAARSVADRTRVASTLLRFARDPEAAPPGGVAFGPAAIEARVRSLLSDAPDDPGIRCVPWTCIACAASLLAVSIAATADELHHALETLFGHLG